MSNILNKKHGHAPPGTRYSCTHPDHVDGESCLERAVGCQPDCPCCVLLTHANCTIFEGERIMDPTANLEEQIKIAREIQQLDADYNATYPSNNSPKLHERLLNVANYVEEHVSKHTIREAAGAVARFERLAELVLALDEWRRKGGFDRRPHIVDSPLP